MLFFMIDIFVYFDGTHYYLFYDKIFVLVMVSLVLKTMIKIYTKSSQYIIKKNVSIFRT